MQGSQLSRVMALNTPFLAQLIDGVVHHEGLNADRPPSIENCELEIWSMAAQLILRLEQSPYDSGSQTKGIPT
jgi:hypothetical protein